MQYYQPRGIDDPNAGYIDGDPQQGIKGSVIPAGAVEFPQREIVNIITKGGFVPNANDSYQLTQGVRRALFSWGIDTGSANSMSVSLDPPITAYAQGLEIRILVANDNTSATTIRVNGLTTQQIIKKDGSTLVPGDLKQGGVAILVYDGANFQLISGAAGSTTITGGWFNGADYMVDTGPPNHIQGTPVVVPTSYYAGQSFLVLVGNANTGPTDINVAGLGIRPLLSPKSLQLGAGDIVQGMLMRVSFDGTQFTMLSPIHMAIIETVVTRNVGPNAGADFADLTIALEWASRRIIDDNGWLILQLQNQSGGTPVVHNYAKNVIFDHPQGERIYVLGGPLNQVPSNWSTTGNPNADAPPILAYFRTCFRAELRFSSPFGIHIRSNVGFFQNFLVSGPGMNVIPPQGIDTGIGIHVYDGATLNFDTVAVSMFYSNWWLQGGSAFGRNIYAVGSNQAGIVIAQNAVLNVYDAFAMPTECPVTMGTGHGFFLVHSCLSDGIVCNYGSALTINTWNRPQSFACDGAGLTMWGAASCDAPYFDVQVCIQGVNCTDCATAAIQYATVANCTYGIIASFNASIEATTSNTGGISYADYQASNGGQINAGGYANGSAQFSPTRGTVGNGGAYISA